MRGSPTATAAWCRLRPSPRLSRRTSRIWRVAAPGRGIDTSSNACLDGRVRMPCSAHRVPPLLTPAWSGDTSAETESHSPKQGGHLQRNQGHITSGIRNPAVESGPPTFPFSTNAASSGAGRGCSYSAYSAASAARTRPPSAAKQRRATQVQRGDNCLAVFSSVSAEPPGGQAQLSVSRSWTTSSLPATGAAPPW